MGETGNSRGDNGLNQSLAVADDMENVVGCTDRSPLLVKHQTKSTSGMGWRDRFKDTAFTAPAPRRSPEERELVRRLDIFLLTFGCISQVIKYLDQQNINNAFVSGMQEDLNLHGDELNYFTTAFNVAYCIMLVPSQIILTYVRPSWWLPGLEIGWGLITGLMAIVQNAKQVYILRVFLGAMESSAWPGMVTLFMHWYTPLELAKRIGFYHSCQAIGNMLSGALMGGITATMDGRYGLAGWRWLFVINCTMTVVWGALGLFMLPDTPDKPNPWSFWFKHDHGELAIARLLRHKRAEPKRITWTSIKRTFSGWVIYFIAVLYTGTVLATYGYVYMSVFLKKLRYPDGTPRWTTEQANIIPVGGGAINVAFVWIWALLSDLLRTRWTLIIAQGVIGIIPCIIMSVWTAHPTSTPIAAAYASYFINFMALGTAPLIFAWLSDLIPQDPEARSLTVGIAVAFYYSISAWSQVLVWPASQAPYYKYGWQSCLAIWILVLIMVCVLRYIDVKHLKPKREAFGQAIQEGEVEVAGRTQRDVDPSIEGEDEEDDVAKKGPERVIASRID